LPIATLTLAAHLVHACVALPRPLLPQPLPIESLPQLSLLSTALNILLTPLPSLAVLDSLPLLTSPLSNQVAHMPSPLNDNSLLAFSPLSALDSLPTTVSLPLDLPLPPSLLADQVVRVLSSLDDLVLVVLPLSALVNPPPAS